MIAPVSLSPVSLSSLLLSLSLATHAAWAVVPQQETAAQQLAAELSTLVDSAARTTGAGVMLRVDAPTVGLAWAKAAGLSSHTAGDRLRPDQPMRVASNTKTFVAAAILLLSEDGALTLDTSIAALIRPSSVATLIRGGYDPHRITVRMLLQHTSGLFDFASTPSYVGRIMSAPNHRWTRAEQMELAMTSGAPFGEPGAVYRYSDTGYLLLGEILETATRRPMPSAVRTLLSFSTRGLGHTWFESLEPVPAGSLERAHQYIDSVDTYAFDPSMDLWGGGGLVSTLHDLSQFYRMLLRGEIFRQRAHKVLRP